MYDPHIGRWLEEDPIGFAAGDPNLYRYVRNNPTNATDPSGLHQRGSATASWDFWATVPREMLDISEIGDHAEVTRILGLLDTAFSLAGTLPTVQARFTVTGSYVDGGRQAPSHPAVTTILRTIHGWPQVTPAQLARINLRVNLLSIKQHLVSALYTLIRDNSHGRNVNMGDVEAAANRVADDLIRIVDRFLRTHPGASPSLGSRDGWFGIQLPGATRSSHPWCADWAEAMDAWIGRQIRQDQNHPGNQYWRFDWGQCNHNNGQHNFIIVAPAWHIPQMSRSNTNIVDRRILLFDPWRDIMPGMYPAEPLTGNRRSAPTTTVNPHGIEDPHYRIHDP